jgi:hypothetical protein
MIWLARCRNVSLRYRCDKRPHGLPGCKTFDASRSGLVARRVGRLGAGSRDREGTPDRCESASCCGSGAKTWKSSLRARLSVELALHARSPAGRGFERIDSCAWKDHRYAIERDQLIAGRSPAFQRQSLGDSHAGKRRVSGGMAWARPRSCRRSLMVCVFSGDNRWPFGSSPGGVSANQR